MCVVLSSLVFGCEEKLSTETRDGRLVKSREPGKRKCCEETDEAYYPILRLDWPAPGTCKCSKTLVVAGCYCFAI